MTITKSENRDRYHAEQITLNGKVVGFGHSRSEAIAECMEKAKCPVCQHTLTCNFCRASKGAKKYQASLTAEERSERGKKAVMAREAKKKL